MTGSLTRVDFAATEPYAGTARWNPLIFWDVTWDPPYYPNRPGLYQTLASTLTPQREKDLNESILRLPRGENHSYRSTRSKPCPLCGASWLLAPRSLLFFRQNWYNWRLRHPLPMRSRPCPGGTRRCPPSSTGQRLSPPPPSNILVLVSRAGPLGGSQV